MKIFLNAGHGGTDPGACSKHNIKESDVSLVIATMLLNRLKLNGYPVQLFQQKEHFYEITKAENISGVNCFISIHCNSFTNPEANGVEVLYAEGSTKGEKLAKIMQEELVEGVCLKNRGIKARKDLHVLNRTKAPAILIELAFISNPTEEKLLVERPEVFANAIWEGIKKFKANNLI